MAVPTSPFPLGPPTPPGERPPLPPALPVGNRRPRPDSRPRRVRLVGSSSPACTKPALLVPSGHVCASPTDHLQFLYEEQLAALEAQALGCSAWTRHPTDPWTVSGRFRAGSGFVLGRSAYVASVDGRPAVYDQLVRPAAQGGLYNLTRSVNQALTHWVYPYRGKFHPPLARALLNLVGAGPGTRILDPYVGSGTTAVEASLLGAEVVGVDRSPLCVLLTRVKACSHTVLAALRDVVPRLLGAGPIDPFGDPVGVPDAPALANFVLVARLVAVSDVTRRRRQGPASFARVLERMLRSVEAYDAAVRAFGLRPGAVRALEGDASDLRAAGIPDGTVDGVVTSPPYSSAIDYVANDAPALDQLGVDPSGLRSVLTGLRGSTPRERAALYDRDLRAMVGEVFRVLRPGGRAAFVIGDPRSGGVPGTGSRDLARWAVEAGLRPVLQLRKCVHGLYSVMRDEMVLLFRKPASAPSGPFA